jgi:hypothetical protein
MPLVFTRLPTSVPLPHELETPQVVTPEDQNLSAATGLSYLRVANEWVNPAMCLRLVVAVVCSDPRGSLAVVELVRVRSCIAGY